VFDQLLESGHRVPRRFAWGPGVALALHVTAISLMTHHTIPAATRTPFILQPTSLPPAERGRVSRTEQPAPVVIVNPICDPVPTPTVPDIPLTGLQTRFASNSGVPGQSIATTLGSEPECVSTVAGPRSS
jgi:hypothetical protein